MVAVAVPLPIPRPERRPPVSLPPVSAEPVGVPPASQPGAEVYRRRRVVALVVAVLLVQGLVQGAMVGARIVADAVAGTSSPEPAAGVAPVVGATAPITTYRVRRGDTLWSIARSLHSEGDIRTVVDRLARSNGGAPLEVGQVLVLE